MAYANIFSNNGFTPVNLEAIKSPIRRIRPVAANRVKTISATEVVLCVGDAYTLDATGNAQHAGPNDTVFGIVELITLAPLTSVMNGQGPVSQEVFLSTDSGSIVGIEDRRVDFEAQTDTFATSNEAGLFNLVDALYSSLFRQSRQSLNIGGGAGAQFRVIDKVNRPTDNAYGTNCRVICNLAQALN